MCCVNYYTKVGWVILGLLKVRRVICFLPPRQVTSVYLLFFFFFFFLNFRVEELVIFPTFTLLFIC